MTAYPDLGGISWTALTLEVEVGDISLREFASSSSPS
jgi:hypothetical protein